MYRVMDGAVTRGRSYGRAVRDVLEVALDNWSIELFEDDAGRRPLTSATVCMSSASGITPTRSWRANQRR